MTKPSDKTKKKKFRRTVKGKSKAFHVRGKSGKHHCALCNGILHGVPHSKTEGEIRKLSKSKKRPEVVFGGMLCSKCRTRVTDETIKLRQGVKDSKGVDLRLKPFVEVMEKMIK